MYLEGPQFPNLTELNFCGRDHMIEIESHDKKNV